MSTEQHPKHYSLPYGGWTTDKERADREWANAKDAKRIERCGFQGAMTLKDNSAYAVIYLADGVNFIVVNGDGSTALGKVNRPRES